MIKCSIFLLRHPELTRDMLVTDHREKHAPLSTSIVGDPEYLRVIRPDEVRFLDLAACRFLVTDPTDVA